MSNILKPIVSFIAILCMLTGNLFAQDAEKKMSISISDASTGTTLYGVQIKWMSYGDNGQQRGEVISNDEGFAAIPLPGKGYRYYQLSFSKAGYVPVRANWPARGEGNPNSTNEPPESYELVMEPARSISGKVVDEAGQPVGNASVVISLHKKIEAPNAEIDVSWKTIKTKADGTWKLDNTPATIDRADVAAYHPQYSNSPEGYFGFDQYPKPNELLEGTAVITLPRGVQVEGTVIDPDGKPIQGAKVGWGTDRVASNVLPEVTTDASGKFTFGSKPDITATLTVKAKGFGPELKTLVVGKENATIEFKMKPPKTITAKITGPDGKPINGGRVYIDTWRNCRTLNQSININSSGQFVWKEAPEDEVLVDILPNGGLPAKRRVSMKASDQEIVVSLGGGLSVHGTVVDAETGKPIEKFKVTQGVVFEGNPGPSWFGNDGRVRGENGEFTMKFDQEYPAYVVRIDAEGYKRAVSRVIKPDENKVELEYKLEKGKSLSGIVKDVDGKPLAGAKVIVATPSQTAYIQNGTQHHRQGNDESITDENGKYVLPEQIDAYALVVVTENGYAIAHQKDLSADGELKLKSWGKVEGSLLLSGKPAKAGESIHLSINEDNYDPKAARVYFAYQAKTDQDGKFSFDRVPAGKGSASRMVEKSMGQMRMSQPTHSERFELDAGKTVAVKLGGKGRPVIGKVNLPEDKIKGRNIFFNQATIHTPYPVNQMELVEKVKGMKPEEQQAFYQKWMETDEGKAYQEKMRKYAESAVNFTVDIKPDGTFRAEDVPAGKFDLGINLTQPDTANNPWGGKLLAMINKPFEVPEIPGGVSDQPLDLGTIELDWSHDK